jgi:hypothetical protein
MFALVTSRQFQVPVRRPARLFDESMQQDHPAILVDIEKHARDSVLHQADPHFKKAVA